MSTLKLHCGGKFVKHPVFEYVGGGVYVYGEEGKTDPDCLCFKDIVDDIKKFSQDDIWKVFYLLPNHSMPNGLLPLENDNDVLKLAQVLYEHRVADVFVEHVETCDVVDADDEDQYDFESDEELVQLFDVSFDSDNDELEVLGSRNQVQQELEVPVEIVDNDITSKDGCTATKSVNKQKGPGRKDRKRSDTKRKKLPDPIGNDLFFINSRTDAGSGESEYFDSDDPGVYDSDDLEDELFVKDDATRQRTFDPVFNPNNDIPIFELKMKFENREQFKDAIRTYAIKKGCVLEWLKNDAKCQRLQCTGAFCRWFICATLSNRDLTWRIVSYVREHNCYKKKVNPMANSLWLAKYMKPMIDANPMIKLRELKTACSKELGLNVYTSMMARAKAIVLKELEGNYFEEYAALLGYRDVLVRKNPENTIHVNYDRYINEPNPVFKSIYVCLAACKKGWMEGCRPIIGIDGCFLKGMCKGVLLAATGRDGNNQMFPIAWAVVDSESNETWGWFLCHLKKDLKLGNGSNLTIVSDQHKAIISSVKCYLPEAWHRHCVRHLYSNWGKSFKGEELKKVFWACAKSTYLDQFEKNFQRLAELTPEGFNAISILEGKFWCKAFFEFTSKCDMVDNNLSETFNSWILEARCKAIITMLEEIRHMVMERIRMKRAFALSWEGEIAPRIVTILKHNVEEATTWTIEENGGGEYEIIKDDQRHVVNLQRKECTCRGWNLTGIPCNHVIAAMCSQNLNFEDEVAHWYKRTTYIQAYKYPVDCIQGSETWNLHKGEKLQPPPFRKLKGRPRVNRIKSKDEPKKLKKGQVEKLSRKGVKMTCSLCGQKGHNMKGCHHKNDPNFKPELPKKVPKAKKSSNAPPPQPKIIFNVREAFCGPSTKQGKKRSDKKDSTSGRQKKQKKGAHSSQTGSTSSQAGQNSSTTAVCLTQGSQSVRNE